MMTKPKVILLGHQAHVGKDTLGEFLVKQDNFVRFGFADKLKDVVADLYGFTEEHMYGTLKNVVDERYGLTPREILQDFGQEQRARFSDIWADYVFRGIESTISRTALHSSYNQKKNFVITDFRFPNEHTVGKRYAERLGWDLVAVKIVRPDDARGEFAGSTNISETALDGYNFDFEIYNTKTKEVLYERFKRFVLPDLTDRGPSQVVTVDLSFMEK